MKEHDTSDQRVNDRDAVEVGSARAFLIASRAATIGAVKRSFAVLLVLALFGAGPGFAMLLCGCSGPPKAHCCCASHDDEAGRDELAVPCHTIEVERAGITLAEAPAKVSLSVPTLVALPVIPLPPPPRVAARAPERAELPGVAPPYLLVLSLRI